MGKPEPLDADVIGGQLFFLQGKVLTIIEASVTNTEQLKAIKDLVKNAFSDQQSYILQMCYPQTQFLTRDQAVNTLDGLEEFEKDAQPVED